MPSLLDCGVGFLHVYVQAEQRIRYLNACMLIGESEGELPTLVTSPRARPSFLKYITTPLPPCLLSVCKKFNRTYVDLPSVLPLQPLQFHK